MLHSQGITVPTQAPQKFQNVSLNPNVCLNSFGNVSGGAEWEKMRLESGKQGVLPVLHFQGLSVPTQAPQKFPNVSLHPRVCLNAF